MASDLETNPYELKKMISFSSKNLNSIISADRWISDRGFSDYGIIKFLANFTFPSLLPKKWLTSKLEFPSPFSIISESLIISFLEL